MKKLIIPILLLILLSLSVTAIGEYYYPSYETYDLQGLWSGDLRDGVGDVTANLVSTSTNGSWTTPLVGDLDGNGINEIVLVDGDNVEIYQEKTLEAISGKSAEDAIQHAVLFDLDGDDTLEVLTVGGDKYSIFDFNGTTLTLTANYTILNSTGADSYQYMIGCGITETCVVVNARVKGGVPSNEHVFVMKANSTGMYNSIKLKTSINNGDFTLPKVRSVSYANMYGTGDQFVFSAFDYGNGQVCYWYITITSGATTKAYERCVAASDVRTDTGRDDFTSPLVGELDPTESGMEVVIAYQADSTQEFRMDLYASDGSLIERYPDITYTQGTIISNPVRAQVFGDTSGSRDFCVMGYWSENDELKLLCGGYNTDESEFDYDDVPYDLDETHYFPSNLLHAIQTTDTIVDGVNPNEFLTPYGVFEVNFGFFDDTLEAQALIVDYQDGIAVPSDVEKIGYFDILYRTADGLVYIDDGFTNTQATIESTSLTPTPLCVDRRYTLGVGIEDINGDIVTCWVEIENEAGNDLQNLTNKSGNTLISFYYTPNTTNAFEFITIFCTDSISPVPDEAVLSREISNDTDVCNDPSVTPEVINEETSDEDAADIAVLDVIDETLGLYNLDTPIVKLILGMVIAFALMLYTYKKTKQVSLSIFAGVGGLIISIVIGFVEVWILVAILILAAAFTVYKLVGGGGAQK